MTGGLLVALALSGPAAAESADLLSRGASVIYGGTGVGTFERGSSGELRDRQWRGHLDLYGAVGATDWLQLAADAPLVVAGVQQIDGRGPCPTTAYEPDYCDTTATLGEVGLSARARILGGQTALAAGLGVRSDAWNAGTRHRWTNAGLGTTAAVGSLVGGRRFLVGGVVAGALAAGELRLVAGREVDAGLGASRLPGHAVAGLVELWADPGPARLQLGLSGTTRLSGVDFGRDYTDYYRFTPDRWASLRYEALRAELKVSVPLSEEVGLHVAAGRVAAAANGPRDAADLSVGVHRWFPGPRG